MNDKLDDAAAEMRAIVLTERGQGAPVEEALSANCLVSSRSGALKAALESFSVDLAGTLTAR